MGAGAGAGGGVGGGELEVATAWLLGSLVPEVVARADREDYVVVARADRED